MDHSISVIICAHNPKPLYLRRVLEALRAQKMAGNEWELLLIDNASARRLADEFDLSWHPHSRHVREAQLGQAFARQRGIREAAGSLLVFVDDDNVLTPDYLVEAFRIGRECPHLGVWGGSIVPEFEVEPPPHLRRLLGCLALREVESPTWTNDPGQMKARVWGAGMCVRADVAREYCRQFEHSKIRITGRRGHSDLACADDVELCYVACATGYGMGLFPELTVTHLIPKERLARRYIYRLTKAEHTSDMMVAYKWKGAVPPSLFSVDGFLRLGFSFYTRSLFECRFRLSGFRGILAARKAVRQLENAAAASSGNKATEVAKAAK